MVALLFVLVYRCQNYMYLFVLVYRHQIYMYQIHG